MTVVSVSAYARLHGVTKGAAQKWQTRGLLKFKDGKVDVQASDRSLAHAGVGRFALGGKGSRERPATGPTVAAPKVAASVAKMAQKVTDVAVLEEELAPFLIRFAEGLAAGQHVDLITAQTIKENGLALIRLIEARKRAGEVMEVSDAESVFFEMFRQQRDAWMNFPSRVGPLIAADLELKPETVVEVLKGHVHQHLIDLGEPDDPLAEVREAPASSSKRMGTAAATDRQHGVLAPIETGLQGSSPRGTQ